MSDVWSRWEGHVIDGTFPLLRYLGSSDHSGVFLTEPRSGELSKAAVKLLPVIPSLVDAQLSHWRVAAGLAHPRLIQLYDSGRCQLGEQHFLFLLMEYAEQNLAEVLPHRALTVDEAREMLLATLEPLAFLHGQQRVQGQLKPSNILVIGDQLKLASDTIRPASEATANISMPTLYDAPEGEREIFSTASDIWALGVTLAEALTKQPPSWTDSRRASVVLPEDFPAAFGEVVRRCLSPDPKARPSVAALLSWAHDPGTPLTEPEPMSDVSGARATTVSPAGTMAPSADATTAAGAGAALGAGAAAVPGAAAPTIPGAGTPPDGPGARTPAMTAERRPGTAPTTPPPSPFSIPEPTSRRRFPPAILTVVGAAAVAVAIWAAMHVFSQHSRATIAADTAAQSPPAAAVADHAEQAAGPREGSGTRETQATPGSGTREAEATPGSGTHEAQATPGNGTREAPGTPESKPPSVRARTSPSASASKAARSGQASAAVVHEEIPRVPKSARDTIHGRIKVSVRVTVDRSGAVISETLENPGPSHYFARLATQAARKWKFAPSEDHAPREWLLHFEFSREATTGHASGPRPR